MDGVYKLGFYAHYYIDFVFPDQKRPGKQDVGVITLSVIETSELAKRRVDLSVDVDGFLPLANGCEIHGITLYNGEKYQVCMYLANEPSKSDFVRLSLILPLVEPFYFGSRSD